MVVDRNTGLMGDMGVTDEMMAHPDPRVPLIDPEHIPEELQAELGPAFAWSKQMWGTVPRYLRMLGHAPVTHLRAKQNKAAWEAMKEHFTTRQIVELTFICGMWNLSGRVAEALHLVVESPGKRIEFQTEHDPRR